MASTEPLLMPIQAGVVATLTTGFGFTVTSTVKELPKQFCEDFGITVYLITPAAVELLFVRIWPITFPQEERQSPNPEIEAPEY
ncbi:MAG: hypothetical protein JPMHGGIA_02817 [Saprospiraceae bacterium]|nr:hypothetical protein [Saprospiraceae bacterium]